MKISPQTQQFLSSQVDKNKNGTSYGELQQALDQNKDGKIDVSTEAQVSPEDKAVIEKVLKEAAEGKYNPSEIAFPAPSKSVSTGQSTQINPVQSIKQLDSLTVPGLPWPVPAGLKIPGAMLREKFGFTITSPDTAIRIARAEIKDLFSAPKSEIRYNPNLKDAGKFDPLTGKIEIGNDAFRSPAYLRATLTHELVHRRNFMEGRLFQQALGQSEIEAYNFVLNHSTRLGLSSDEIMLQQALRDQVETDWKTGKEPGYARPVSKPTNFEATLKFLQSIE